MKHTIRFFLVVAAVTIVLLSCELFQLQPAARENPKDPGTRERSWSEPVMVSTNSTGYAYDPQVASDGAGNAVAVWQVEDDAYERIWTSTYTADNGWSTAQQLDNPSWDYAYYPNIACIGSGSFIAVWEQDTGTSTGIYSRTWNATGGWGEIVLVSTDANFAGEPHIDFNVSGNGFAVWEHYDDTNADYDIHGCRYISGSGWSTPSPVSDEETDVDTYNPRIACNSAGNAAVVWEEYNGDRYSVYGSLWTPEEDWWWPHDLDSGWTSRTQRSPETALDDSGYGLGLFYEYNPNTAKWNLYALPCNTLTGWSDTADLLTAEEGESEEYLPLSILFDSNGTAIAAWSQMKDYDTSYNLYSNTYTHTLGWGDEECIEVEMSGHSALPIIDFDGEGNCLAVWYQITPSALSFWSNLYLPGSGWGSPEMVGQSPEVVLEISENSPGLSVDAAGDAFAAWLEYENEHTFIMAAVYQ